VRGAIETVGQPLAGYGARSTMAWTHNDLRLSLLLWSGDRSFFHS